MSEPGFVEALEHDPIAEGPGAGERCYDCDEPWPCSSVRALPQARAAARVVEACETHRLNGLLPAAVELALEDYRSTFPTGEPE